MAARNGLPAWAKWVLGIAGAIFVGACSVATAEVLDHAERIVKLEAHQEYTKETLGEIKRKVDELHDHLLRKEETR